MSTSSQEESSTLLQKAVPWQALPKSEIYKFISTNKLKNKLPAYSKLSKQELVELMNDYDKGKYADYKKTCNLPKYNGVQKIEISEELQKHLDTIREKQVNLLEENKKVLAEAAEVKKDAVPKKPRKVKESFETVAEKVTVVQQEPKLQQAVQAVPSAPKLQIQQDTHAPPTISLFGLLPKQEVAVKKAGKSKKTEK